MKHIKLFEQFTTEGQLSESEGYRMEEFEITEYDEIEGHRCLDFEPKDLVEGDIIYRKLVDTNNWKFRWAKDSSLIKGDELSQYSTADEYKIISNDGVILKTEKIR